MSKKINETLFKSKDVDILRERLCWALKKSPPEVATIIDQSLKLFAFNVKDYCKHEMSVFIKQENKYGCLNCGTRQTKEEFESGK